MLTHTNVIPVHHLGAITAKVDNLNRRVARYGLGNPVEITAGEPALCHDPDPEIGDRWMMGVEIRWEPIGLPGDWDLIASVDFVTADEPLTYTFGEDEPPTVDVVDTRCDHCGTVRQRHMIHVVRNHVDGTELRVGSTCLQDALGIDPRWVIHIAELAREIADDDYDPSGGSGEMPTVSVVAAAQAAIDRFGWRKSSMSAATKDEAYAALTGHPAADPDVVANYRSPSAVENAQRVIDWVAALEPTDEFTANAVTVARSTWIGSRAIGIAAYLPEMYARAMADERAKAAAPAPTPVPEGRHVVTGEVVRITERETQWGTQVRMTVADDRGFRVNGTVPRAILPEVEIGARVEFTATLEAAEDREGFGFASRPSKASIL